MTLTWTKENSPRWDADKRREEAVARGLNYIYNVVPEAHPDGAWIRNWLSAHGFHEASRGQLRRQVVMPVMGTGSQ